MKIAITTMSMNHSEKNTPLSYHSTKSVFSRYFWSTFLCLLFLVNVSLVVTPPAAVSAATVKLQVEVNNTTKTYKNSGQAVTYDGATISTKKLPAVKINNTWMVSASEVFEKGLGCKYTYEESSGQITLQNPNTETTISFLLGSKKVEWSEADEEDKNTSGTLPVSAVFATNLSTGETGILVPASFLAKQLGFHCAFRAGTNTLAFTTTTFLDRDAAIPKYNTSIYSNVLTTILLEQNTGATRQELSVITANKTSENNVLIDENDNAGIYTYTFLDTYNALGDMEKSFSNSFVEKISISNAGNNCIVTVVFKEKYSSMTLLEDDGISASFSSSVYSLKIPLPETVKFSQVKDTDQYMKKQFVLEIPGDWEAYYEEKPVIMNNSVIQDVSVKVTAADNTRITVKTKKLQGYQLTEKKGFFTVMMDDPQKIYDNIVVLDAGHGGKDNGATNRGTKEKNLNYTIIYSKAKEYFDSKDSNIKAYWTRYDDTFISLSDRAKFASTVGADLFISLHMNSCTRSSVNGMEIFYSTDNNTETESGLTSRILARKMLNQLKGDLNASSRGVKTAGFYVIKHNTVPAILIELGFLSGNSDYHKLTSASYQKKAAKSIYQCVNTIFAQYPTQR